MKKRRSYRLRERAERQRQTREQIVAATMALHEELGPRATTVSAIAERAGVERLTVYRHFPDQDELFAACSSRWLEQHPPPGKETWGRVAEPGARTVAALTALYEYYRRTERMWAVSYRDLEDVPSLRTPMAGFHRYLRGVRDDLAQAWSASVPDPRPLEATLSHGVRFATWRSLAREGMKPAESAALVARWLAGLGER